MQDLLKELRFELHQVRIQGNWFQFLILILVTTLNVRSCSSMLLYMNRVVLPSDTRLLQTL